MSQDMLFGLVGGLGCFFYGMQLMSEGLKKVSAERLKKILHTATKIPVIGILVGALVTCLIQSSSTATVMVVGFVNAGLMTLKQAISVVMGANIGTTFTAWLVSSMSVFKVTNYALPAMGIGFALMKLGKTRKARFTGQIIFGFGLLFLGLEFMKDAFAPLKESQGVKNMFVMFGSNPILGVIVGVLFTIALQSSSATIAIVQVLAFNGVLSFSAAIPIILGDNIGTTITAQMAALGTNLNARRAAMSHSLFNIIGVGYMLVFVYLGWYERAIRFVAPGEITTNNVMMYIAISHSAFNIFNTAVFLPFIGWLERISIILVPQKKGMVEMGTQYLDKHLLDTPQIALEQAKKEISYMLKLAVMSIENAYKAFTEGDKEAIKKVHNYEQAVDNLQSEITRYLVELSQKNLSEEETEGLPVLIHSVNDVERISDHSENISELSEKKVEEKINFSPQAEADLLVLWTEVESMMNDTKEALKNDDKDLASKILLQEKNIDNIHAALKKKHVDRVGKGLCDMKAAMTFVNLVDNLEKVADHLSNIAEGIVSGMRWQWNHEHAVNKA